ncbi:DUF1059 domain-containing protein [Candidatus Woesearchaeota archaeon]|nr:DUF1059 domain-containing protein [Candidatus Woesearchaeota archaeon]
MKTLKCSDLGSEDGCEFEASGETNEEVVEQMFAHAAEAHKDKLEGMSEEVKQSMVQKMNEMLDAQ